MKTHESSPRCLISAGPTREYLDAFRFISNPSSGKMGYALAAAALRRGWSVDLVSGPVCLSEPEGSILYPVETGEEMYHQIDALFDPCDIFIMAAAVCDFRPINPSKKKLKREDHPPSIAFERVTDILQSMVQRRSDQFVVGFAAETEALEENALTKLRTKGLDLIVANSIAIEDSAFASDSNRILMLDGKERKTVLGPDTKENLAERIIDAIDQARGERSPERTS